MAPIGKTSQCMRSVLCLLVAAVAAAGSSWADKVRDVDRSRAGEMLLRHEVRMMEEYVYPYATVEARWLPLANISAMGRAFHVRPAAIRRFRWGYSMAPSGHVLEKSVWYTIWHQSESDRVIVNRTTLRVDELGRVIEERVW
ncbi:MAG: hypothetical protein VX293_00945 [Candidatus Latescibacterota bacterium]|nr:hypothetical protein [Candidatus Latescibacterota bacterium]